MSFNVLLEVLKYLDFYGTNFNFYTEKNRKFYTAFGGILSLLSIIVGILVFIFINLEDFLHNAPISTTSQSREDYYNIKFLKEKIWIPWRIRDYNSKTVNFTGLLFPIVFYYKGIKNKTKNSLDLSYTIINYRLCNETSMANFTDSYIINIELNQLFCIDMDDLDMGGSWDTDFINYIEFDLYACKDGIDYDENNINCSSYEKIMNEAPDDNSFEFEMFYPVVHYQPMNKKKPIFVKYANYFYHLSRFSNKIDRIYLQKYVLIDDNGWIIKKENIYSHWGYITLSGDSYATGDKKDLMNEGSSSRFYSFNIYIKFETVYYNRSYKKLYLIIADGLPIVNVIFIIFKMIAKVFKISSGNKKLTELLFENLQEKQNKVVNPQKFSALNLKLNKKKIISEKKFLKNNNSNILQNNQISLNNNTTNNKINDASSIQLSQYEEGKMMFQGINKRKSSIRSLDKSKIFQKSSLNNQSNNNNQNNDGNIEINNKNVKNNSNNYKECNNEKSSPLYISKAKIKKKYTSDKNKFINNKKIKNKTYYIQKTLFPYKYYLCSIFIKNIDISKKPIFFTKKFSVVYNFICQLFDISSYLILQREFQILKSTLMIGKYRAVLENSRKINVNDHSFNTDMKECLDSHKFSILGRVKNSKDIND